MAYDDCYLNLAAGQSANNTPVYAHQSEKKGGYPDNVLWKEKHFSPGEI